MSVAKKQISLLLVFVMLMMTSIFTLNTSAASVSYYQTSKDNVAIRASASKNATKVKTVQYSGTVLKAVGSKTNSEGNLWYKLNDGNWVYSGNVVKHSHSYNSSSGGYCTGRNCGYEWPYSVSSASGTFQVTNSDGAKIWSRPYSNKSTHYRTLSNGSTLTINGKTTNKEGNVWYRLTDGSWVYSGNVTQRYTITYNANGGSGAPSTQYILKNVTFTLASQQPKRVGYIFKGWATSSSATSAKYYSGKKYSGAGDKTLYAVWEKCGHPSYTGGYCDQCNYQWSYSISTASGTYEVTNSDGAKIWSRPYSNKSTHYKTLSKGSTITINGKTTNQEGNVWYRLTDGSWVYSGNVKKRLTISYKANGGSGAPGSQATLSGNTLKLSATKPKRVGYIFKGWATSSDSTKVNYKPGSSYKFSKNMTLYAVWEKCSHTSYSGGICTTCKYEYPLKETKYTGTFVVTNDNGAPAWSRPYSTNSKKIKYYDKNAVLKVVAKVKNIDSKGKTDNLWYKVEDGNWVYSENVTERYSVKYNANGGTGAPKTQNFLSGKSVVVSKSKPSRVGYTFQGWATKSDSTKVSYKPGSKYSKDKNLTLYAIWSKCSHKYNSSGVCDVCKYQYKIKLDSSFTGSYVVIESNGAKIRNVPYETSGSTVRTAKKGEILKVVGKATNAHKNVWYKLDTGHWVYSKRVASGYKVTYNANGGTGAPKSTGFVSGKLVVSSTVPTRVGYVFMGWATSADATKATYKTGDTYNTKKNITLYAVWKKCTHNYDNNYGICKKCKSEFPLVVTSFDDTVYLVNNKNGTNTYKRPYSKASEKVKKLSNKTSFLAVGSAQNANKELWYKMKNGSWIKASDVKKQPTFTSIGGIPVKCSDSEFKSYPACFTILQKGTIGAKKISGKWYYSFGYTESKTTYTIYVSVTAFTGASKNTQYAKVNKAMNDAINAPKGRLSLKNKQFIYNKKSEGEMLICDSNGMLNNQNIRKPSVSWNLNLLEASAGIDTSEVLDVLCKYKGNVSFLYCPYLIEDYNLSNKVRSPQTATEYLLCLKRGTASANLKPKISVTVEPDESRGKYVGYLTDCTITGKGYAPKKLELGDYIELFTCAVDIGTSVVGAINNPVSAPQNIYKAITKGWSLATTVSGYTKSADYKSNKNNISYYDSDNGREYYSYSMSLKSPIALQEKNDYIKITVCTNNLQEDQKVTINLGL